MKASLVQKHGFHDSDTSDSEEGDTLDHDMPLEQ